MNYIPIAKPRLGEDEAKAAYDVVKSGWISMGKKVQQFEQMICDYTDAKYAVAMNNGTSTLHSILNALNIGPGDEVIIPSLTYISSANVIMYQGATPILCDSEQLTFNTNADFIKEKITSKTKAFMTVDLKGLPVDYDKLVALSEDTGIPLISDSAESYGSIYKNKKVGTQSLAHSFSFFANKNITTGEGGVVTTNDINLYKKLQIIRNQGQEGRYNHTYLGNNFRMTDICAAIGIEQLKKIDNIIDEKVKIAENYTKNFFNYNGIKAPFVPSYVTRPSWYMYSITVDPMIRNDLITYLDTKKIETRLSFPPVHIQPYYVKKFGFKPNDMLISFESYQSFLDIPIWADMGVDRQNKVINEIKSFIKSNTNITS